jgi:hydrogenase maturation protein HypF
VRRYRIEIAGVVQGVGFRPFVKRLADRFRLPGITFNAAGGLIVEIETDHKQEAVRFAQALREGAPPAARIDSCDIIEVEEVIGYDSFRIIASAARDQGFTLVSADLATCAACLEEITSPADRRFRYPFTNCTNCGPRYSITLSTPYDRANTTMRSFALCDACAAEYADPADRRFHAEPIACPACGPKLSREFSSVIAALGQGRIVAIKGLGGFQLACDAFHRQAIESLRMRKRRSRKPFAVMMCDLETVGRYCVVSEAERRLLQSAAAPIVLLRLRDPEAFPDGVAPGLHELGVMLPYTPMHHLLFQDSLTCLVMTSGNLSEEPIVVQNEAAIERLSAIADDLLTHDRDIFMRVDDSTARVFEETPRLLRRARGYAPSAIGLNHEAGEVLGTGAELKNTFCLTKGHFAILSQHIGDLENYETLQFFEETLQNLRDVYQANPRLIAHDLHPDYLTTRWASTRPEPKLAIQHHHAHIASCMAENGLQETAIGVAFDGTGMGLDGHIWGGEFLVCDYAGFRRWAHLRYVPLPGGDRAARQSWRMAAAYVRDAVGEDYRRLPLPCWDAASAPTWKLMDQLLQRTGLMTSSCGRLFDAVSAICGVSRESSYEGESAILLEAVADAISTESYDVEVHTEAMPWIIDVRGMIGRIACEMSQGRSVQAISRCFHESMARMIEMVCRKVRDQSSVDIVCLSGGTFQNFTLLARTATLLRAAGFRVFLHSQVPPNDGGISLGQAVIAAAALKRLS